MFEDFDFGKILTSAVPSLITGGVSLLGGIFGNDAQKDQLDAQKDQSKQDAILKLQLEELRAKYGLLGSKGGGGGGGGTDKTANLLNAYQAYINSNRAARDKQSQAYQELSRAVTAPLLR